MLIHSTHGLIWANDVNHLIPRLSERSQMFRVMDRSGNPVIHGKAASSFFLLVVQTFKRPHHVDRFTLTSTLKTGNPLVQGTAGSPALPSPLLCSPAKYLRDKNIS